MSARMSFKPHTVLLLAALLFGSYFLFAGGGHTGNVPRSLQELWNAGHIVYFAVLVYILRGLPIFDRVAPIKQWGILIPLTLVLGILIEIGQVGTLRNPDWMDVMRDLMGCLLVLAFSPMRRLPGQIWPEVVRFAVGLGLLLLLVPLGVSLLDEAFARKQYPVLSDFATPFELGRWKGNSLREIVQLDAESDRQQMRIDLNTDRYSGAELDYLQGDWQGYQTLVFNIYQPQDEYLPMTLRIHDEQHEKGATPFMHHDRFHRRLVLQTGWNKVEIPLYAVAAAPRTRSMDMQRISSVMLFTSRLKKLRSIYLESVYLAR